MAAAVQQPNLWAGVPWNPDVTVPATPPVFATPDDGNKSPELIAPGASMLSGAPKVFADLPTPDGPSVSRVPRLLETDIDATGHRLQKLRDQDARPFGFAGDTSQGLAPNHPGTGGKILHALSVAGNIAGDIFAPTVMERIPGTELNRSMQENQLSQRLQQLSSAESENEQRGAATEEARQRTAEMPQKADDEHESSSALTRKANDEAQVLEEAPAPVQSLAAGHAYAVQQAIARGEDPSQDPIVKHYEDAIRSTVPGFNKDEAPKTIQLEKDGRPHQMAFDKATGKYDLDQGESGEKPPTVNVNQGEAALDRETKQFGAGHQKSLDAANAQLEKIADARAMINGNAESQGLGIPKVLTALVGGQGTGVRITQAELDSIAHARGMSGDIEGTLNKWAGKGALSKAQQQQLTQIMDDVKARLIEKQGIEQQALDSINGASTRDQILQADKTARKNLSDFEKYGYYAGKTITLKNGKTVTIQSVHPDGSFD